MEPSRGMMASFHLMIKLNPEESMIRPDVKRAVDEALWLAANPRIAEKITDQTVGVSEPVQIQAWEADDPNVFSG
jgi:hypothetical protein